MKTEENNIQRQIMELKSKFIIIKNKEWIKNNCRGRSSVGITFEKEIGKEIEKFEIPDYKNFEIKTKDVGCSDHTKITLFSATPDSFLFIIKDIHRKYEKYEHEVYYRYFNMTFYKLKGFEDFLNLIENGYISVIFKICVYKSNYRKGKINDHGTSFCINFRQLNMLYNKIDSIS